METFIIGQTAPSSTIIKLSYSNPEQNVYRSLFIKHNKIVGIELINDTTDQKWYEELMQNQVDIGKWREVIVFGKQYCQENKMEDQKNIVVIGNGMVGQKFLEELVAKENNHKITVFTNESRPAYDRVHLSEFFAEKTAEDLMLTSEQFFVENNITLYLNEGIQEIDKANKKVLSVQGREVAYDKLVIATGSYPFVPPIEGKDQPHCLVYRTIEDLEAIQNSAKEAKVGVVVGGGLLGLEAANALQNLGLETHVVEFAPRLMPVQLDQGASDMLQQKIEKLGITIHTSKNTKIIQTGAQCRYQMQFADESVLETDVIVFSAGIRPYDQLAKEAGLEIGTRGGIVINNHCITSDEHIFAIGECALWNKQMFGLVAPGYQMASIVASYLADNQEVEFTGADMSTKLKLLGVEVGSIGNAHAKEVLTYVYSNAQKEVYKKLLVSKENKQLVGAILIGDASDYGNLLQLMLNNMSLPEEPESLILPNIEKPSMGVEALPDSAQICACHNVSKGDLLQAIADGDTTVAELKNTTKAGTGCGGCVPLYTQLLNQELEKRGITVKKDICEHFAYSRQELYHLIRVERIKTFDEMLEKYGKGHGCHICKPAIGAILTSCWNDYILETPHARLQDTNDAFLANIQKDGTYSIVPRIPGGEITPEKLIIMGQVAQKYKLYTKITGGQRIDLFGARLEQLPLIWKELTDAGFESGHAYGKALRTAKSCVGSTWCRYGVGDSTTLAIDLENRYKGLRTPHKLKMGASGCVRECAEAQAKDVGVIATDKGWNLYVCGNGGITPRHADLLAADLDEKTLFQYIDRFLMFYIKTADRLQRTAAWLENLAGGLEYLKQVIIEDSLGIAQALEQQMQHVVDTYQCEWKTTIENPEKLKRFRFFINSDQTDNNVLFVEERGQVRPATEAEKVAHKEEIV